MRLLIAVSIGAVALVAAAFLFRPWLLIDPIDRFIYLNGASRSMLPEVFSATEPASDVITRLTRSGYVHYPMEPVADEPAVCGDTACERQKAGFTDFFRKPDTADNIACNIDYVVWMKRDGERIDEILSDVYDICL